MSILNKSITVILVVGALSGCASYLQQFEGENKPKRAQQSATMPLQIVNITASDDERSEDGYQGNVFGNGPMSAEYGKNPVTTRLMTKHVGDYVQAMTQDLISNMEYLSDKTPVGVTNFAMIDSDLQTTNILGFQLSESFIHELHKFRIPVIDFKATDYIRVTQQGDFLLTRDYLELTENAPIQYILTGTMTKHQNGYLINARILGLQSKAVVATAQMLLPMHAADALLPSEHNSVDGVQLIQGDE